MIPATPIILCADDFALTAGVSKSIIALLGAGRLSATSAMTNRPHWPEWSKALRAFSNQADIGLHLNLTCAAPLGDMPLLAPGGQLPSLPSLALAAMRSSDIRKEIHQQITRQLDAFEDAMGCSPNFLDGHQHVHVLPGVRRQVLSILAARYPAGSVYLRNPADRLRTIIERGFAKRKALIVTGLAAGLAQQARHHGLQVNEGFSGFSRFDPKSDYAVELQAAFRQPGPRHLIMCHPGYTDDELSILDSVVETRAREHAVLAGAGFAAFLEQGRYMLARFEYTIEKYKMFHAP
jgi:chitin disaccharide deacetylase